VNLETGARYGTPDFGSAFAFNRGGLRAKFGFTLLRSVLAGCARGGSLKKLKREGGAGHHSPSLKLRIEKKRQRKTVLSGKKLRSQETP